MTRSVIRNWNEVQCAQHGVFEAGRRIQSRRVSGMGKVQQRVLIAFTLFDGGDRAGRTFYEDDLCGRCRSL